MRNSIIILLVGFVICLSSCRKDFEFEPSNGGLEFSKDTVYLDTVFTNIGSSTYTLKVYNRSDKDILIPSIKLGKADSKYRMSIDGMTGNDEDNSGVGDGRFFPNVELLANDSLFIYIETTANIADANPTDFLYTDQIQFGSGTNLQTVELVTLIQDAIFLYPQRFDDGTTETLPIGTEGDYLYGFFLDHNDHGDEYHFTADKPYVIYGFAAVGSNETLVIDPGARVHFHSESGIIVANGGKIVAVGGISSDEIAQENEIIFEGDRLEPLFSDVPGQWFGIWLTSGSLGSQFDHVTIKNATLGMYIQNNSETISIKNTQIYDNSFYGILAQTANITGQNVVINSAGQATLACTIGGTYNFTHCTFNNNWASSQQSALVINNYLKDENGQQVEFDLQAANFTNCIIFGSNQTELVIDQSDIETPANWTTPVFTKCQIKFNNVTPDFYTQNPQYAFINDPLNIIKSGNPDFFDINKNMLMIGDDSDAKDFGVDTGVGNDLLNQARIFPNIDLGAYESVVFPPG
jgi:hypothetical protein